MREEAQNLINLQIYDKNVIAPIDYYTDGERELYATPYISQARCVASDERWGMYVPEPFYRFDKFTENQEQVVNTCMIAKLVSLYDFEMCQGIAACKLGGGDFMLEKGWEKQPLTIESTLNGMYLVAAREMITCSFEEYLELIRDEFSRQTIHENQTSLILNHRGRVPMKSEAIESGIELGLKIISTREEDSSTK